MRLSRLLLMPPVAVVALSALSACSPSAGAGDRNLSAESPLAPYADVLWGDGDQAVLDAQALRVEDLVAACMKREGFEYTPELGNGSRYSTENALQVQDEAWVSQNGYGITAAAPALASGGELELSPNEERLQSLTEAEVAEYVEQLYGTDFRDPDAEQAALHGEASGCWGSARAEAAAQSELVGDRPQHASLIERLNEMFLGLRDDPMVQAAERDWADCMADAGHADFSTRSESYRSISDELALLIEPNPAAETAGQRASESALSDLKKREVEIALSDLDCMRETNYTERTNEVSALLEAQFVTDNKVELDEMLAVQALGQN